MRNLLTIILLLSSTLSFASPEVTMKCTLGHKKELKVYGPLGFFYEDDLAQTTEVSFPNKIEILINGNVINTLTNSTSMVNDSNEYTLTAYILNVKDLSLRKVLNLYFASESGSEAHLDINVSNFRYRGKVHCRLIH